MSKLDDFLSCGPREAYILHHLNRKRARGDRVALAKAIAAGARNRAELAGSLGFIQRERGANSRRPVSEGAHATSKTGKR